MKRQVLRACDDVQWSQNFTIDSPSTTHRMSELFAISMRTERVKKIPSDDKNAEENFSQLSLSVSYLSSLPLTHFLSRLNRSFDTSLCALLGHSFSFSPPFCFLFLTCIVLHIPSLFTQTISDIMSVFSRICTYHKSRKIYKKTFSLL